MRRFLAVFAAACLSSCVVERPCPKPPAALVERPYDHANLSVDWIESSVNDPGENTCWYLTNHGPGVAAVDRVSMCLDDEWYVIDSIESW